MQIYKQMGEDHRLAATIKAIQHNFTKILFIIQIIWRTLSFYLS